MKVIKKRVENSQAYLTIEMEPAEMEHGMEDGYRHLVTKVNMPGFRKGKAPARYVGTRARQGGTPRRSHRPHYTRLLIKTRAKSSPSSRTRSRMVEITQAEPLIFKAVVPLAPTVELNDYKSIRMTAGIC